MTVTVAWEAKDTNRPQLLELLINRDLKLQVPMSPFLRFLNAKNTKPPENIQVFRGFQIKWLRRRDSPTTVSRFPLLPCVGSPPEPKNAIQAFLPNRT